MSESIYEKMDKTRQTIEQLEERLESYRKDKLFLTERLIVSRRFVEEGSVDSVMWWTDRLNFWIKYLDDNDNAIQKTEDELQKQRDILVDLERRFYAANVGPHLTYEYSGEELDYDRLMKGLIKGTKL